jgi:DNA-binding response OmpR family regulator
MRGQSLPEPRVEPMTTVLIAHGDPDTRALYRAMLESSSSAIEEAEDGAEALGRAISSTPDVIVVSAQLARIDGLALCRLLRADTATRAIAIVVITTTDSSAESVRAQSAGADLTITGPCAPEAIVEAVRGVITQPRRPYRNPSETSAQENEPTATSPRRPRARMVRREQTTTPPLRPPALHCPQCQSLLAYQHSQTGGVNDRAFEQWDYFRCQACGPYQYRHRTRKLRAT